MPTSVVRWLSFGNTERSLPSAAILTAECVFSLSGLANFLIFRLTRPNLLVAPRGPTLGIAPSFGISRRNSEINIEDIEPPTLDLPLPDTPA
jgi:hypothetical protein